MAEGSAEGGRVNVRRQLVITFPVDFARDFYDI
jgi:hypothetical protein